MVFLLWAILNVVLFLSFIFICFRATKLIRRELGVIFSIIFVFGLLSFIAQPNNGNGKLGEQFKFDLFKDNSKSLENSKFVSTILDSNLIFKILLTVQYHKKDSTALITPVDGSSTTTGIIAGNRWKAFAVSTNVEGTKIKYSVLGAIEWKLLGFNVYTQKKYYTGFIETK